MQIYIPEQLVCYSCVEETALVVVLNQKPCRYIFQSNLSVMPVLRKQPLWLLIEVVLLYNINQIVQSIIEVCCCTTILYSLSALLLLLPEIHSHTMFCQNNKTVFALHALTCCRTQTGQEINYFDPPLKQFFQ